VTGVDLEYSTNNGTNYTTIVLGLANSGKYLWVIPNLPTATALVRVIAHDSQNIAFDVSNAAFTISPGTPLPVPEAELAFSVGRPAPSPFSGTTSIGFTLPSLAGTKKWPTSVRIYNVAGKLVRYAVQADLDPGPHVAAWDGRDEHGLLQPAGVYFIEVATPSARGTVRAVFLR
jgi:hypothetical protein